MSGQGTAVGTPAARQSSASSVPLRRWVLGRGETTAQLLLAVCPGCAFGGFSSVSVFIPLGNLGGNHQYAKSGLEMEEDSAKLRSSPPGWVAHPAVLALVLALSDGEVQLFWGPCHKLDFYIHNLKPVPCPGAVFLHLGC